MEERGVGLDGDLSFFGEDNSPERRVEDLSVGEDVVLIRFTEGSVMTKEGIDEFVSVLVSLFIREFTSFEKRKTYFSVPYRISMLTIVQDGDTKFRIRNITEFMTTYFISSLIPYCISMRRPPQ